MFFLIVVIVVAYDLLQESMSRFSSIPNKRLQKLTVFAGSHRGVRYRNGNELLGQVGGHRRQLRSRRRPLNSK